jgi:hypothetical protein
VPKNHCEKSLKASRHKKKSKRTNLLQKPKKKKKNKTKQNKTKKAKIFPGSLQKQRLEQREAKQIRRYTATRA